MKKIDLSIIILSYNTKDLLEKCLQSVISNWLLVVSNRPQVTNHQLLITEIIVVDNGSTDGSVEMVKKLTTNHQLPVTIKLLENKANLGFAGGNNVGIKQAKGRYILFLNSDTEVYPGSLSEAVNFMDQNPQIGVLTPKTILASGEMDSDCHRGFPTPWASITYFLGLEKLFPKSKLFGQYHKCYLDLNKNHEIDAGAGAFMLIKKEIIDKVGVWDEQYFFYGEDLDYFYRIKKKGYKILYYSKPLLIHHKGGSSGIRKESKKISPASRETKLKVAKESIKAMEIFYRKFYKDIYPVWLTNLVLLGIRIKGWGRYLKQYLFN